MTKYLCEVVENYSQVKLSFVDITSKMSLTYALMRCDKMNNYWFQPCRLESEKENKIDSEAVEMYIQTEWLQDLEDN